MNKTISEVQQAKKELETKIAQMLLNFEKENGVEVSGCYCNSYDKEGCIMTKHEINFSISVRL